MLLQGAMHSYIFDIVSDVDYKEELLPPLPRNQPDAQGGPGASCLCPASWPVWLICMFSARFLRFSCLVSRLLTSLPLHVRAGMKPCSYHTNIRMASCTLGLKCQ